jgi:hypothetical protein
MRASALNLGSHCPASGWLSAELGRMGIRLDTVYTSAGTLAHKFMEIAINQGITAALEQLRTDDERFALSLRDLWEWWETAALVPAPSAAAAISTKVMTEQAVQWDVGSEVLRGTVDLLEIEGSEGWVVDWKFYNDLSLLTPMTRDLQMYAYAVTAAAVHRLDRVHVLRVLGYQLRHDDLDLDRDGLRMAEEVVAQEVASQAAGRTRYVLGAWCHRLCLARAQCPAWREQTEAVREIAPYGGGDFESEAQALRFLLALPAIRELLEEGIEAARRWVQQNKRPVIDTASKLVWGPRQTRGRRAVADHQQVLMRLLEIVGAADALSAAKTTIGGVEAALKRNRIPPDMRRAFVSELAEAELIKPAAPGLTYDWHALGARLPKATDE